MGSVFVRNLVIRGKIQILSPILKSTRCLNCYYENLRPRISHIPRDKNARNLYCIASLYASQDWKPYSRLSCPFALLFTYVACSAAIIIIDVATIVIQYYNYY